MKGRRTDTRSTNIHSHLYSKRAQIYLNPLATKICLSSVKGDVAPNKSVSSHPQPLIQWQCHLFRERTALKFGSMRQRLTHELLKKGWVIAFSPVSQSITKNLTFHISSYVTSLHEYELYTDIHKGMADVPKAIQHSVIRMWNELHFGVSFLVAAEINEVGLF